MRAGADQLKLIAWDATSPDPRRLTNDITGDAIGDFDWSDDDVEALPFLGYDIPEGLLPENLHRLFAGKDKVPVKLSSSEGNQSCEAPSQFADPQWQELTLKHFFGHRTGMVKSSPAARTLMEDHLDVLRGVKTQADFAAQEQLLRDEWGESYIENARQTLGWDAELVQNGPTGGYLVPRLTDDESMAVLAGRCLVYDLSKGHYSNTTPAVMRSIMEHLTGQAAAPHRLSARVSVRAAGRGQLGLQIQTGRAPGERIRGQSADAARRLPPTDKIPDRARVDIEMLRACAERHRVSLIATMLRWLSYTEQRSILVVSRDGFILWARSSMPALRSGAYFETSAGPIEIPMASLPLRPELLIDGRGSIDHPRGIWLNEPVSEPTVFAE